MKTTQIGNEKKCNQCNTIKNIEEFPRADPRSKSYHRYANGIKPWCKDCYRLYNKKYMKKVRTSGSKKYSHYYKKYKLTQEDVILMHEKRNFKCDICNQNTNHRYDKLCVDHCHKTDKVRGLLCFSCNTLLGNAKDSIEILKNAIKYLEKNNEYIFCG